jgi:putative DNA primase/helicase
MRTPSTASFRAQGTHARGVVEALADHTERIAIDLLGEPTSRSPRAYRWGRRGSLWLCRAGPKRGRWFDHELGEGGDIIDLIAREHRITLSEAIRICARDYLSIPAFRQALPQPPLLNDDAEVRARAALRLWDESKSLTNTLGEVYLVEHRGLNIHALDLDHAVRWHLGIRAVIGLMTDGFTGKPTGVHRTFLDANGAKNERKMLGRQGIVRLSPDDEVTMGLGITEGIEDGLAVLLSRWAPVWAATSAGALARFPILAGIEELTIFADADEAGLTKAEACAARWRAAGRRVRIVPPRRVLV